VVGGVATQAYGATRPTVDFDCLIRRDRENLAQLASAMRELNARLRVEGMSDAEAAALPLQLDAEMLSRAEISTWRTDAGDFDVLVNIPYREGRRQRYEDLIGRGRRLEHAGAEIRVVGLDDIVASKEWAGRRKDREALPELYGLRDRTQG
jgi:hypothetical protein